MFKSSPIKIWRNSVQRYALSGFSCVSCKRIVYTKPYRCVCYGTEFATVLLQGRATLISFSIITIPPVEFSGLAPYCIALVELVEGPRLITQLTDIPFAELSIGMPLKAVFRRYVADGQQGLIQYGTKFTKA